MASKQYGVEGTLVSPGYWHGGTMAPDWRIYFTDETRYPIMIRDLQRTHGSITTWHIEVYDNYGQQYLPIVTQGGWQSTTSFIPPDRVFRCVADKAFDKPLRPELINLVKSNSVQTCIKAMDTVMMNTEKTTAELAAAKSEAEALKAEVAAAKTEAEALKAELAATKAELTTKTMKGEKTANTTIMMASALAMGILGLVVKASRGEDYNQTVMPPSWPQLPGVGDLD